MRNIFNREIRMSKREFLERLEKALENGLNSQMVRENMDYYRSYMEEEIRKGRSEEAVVEELGDPWVIAQSVISMAESRSGADAGYSAGNGREEDRRGDYGGQRYSNARFSAFRVNGWWRTLLFVLGIVGILLIVFAVIGGLLSLVMPIVFPVLVVVMVVRLIKRR